MYVCVFVWVHINMKCVRSINMSKCLSDSACFDSYLLPVLNTQTEKQNEKNGKHKFCKIRNIHFHENDC